MILNKVFNTASPPKQHWDINYTSKFVHLETKVLGFISPSKQNFGNGPPPGENKIKTPQHLKFSTRMPKDDPLQKVVGLSFTSRHLNTVENIFPGQELNYLLGVQ
jgi:hypothetical protein